MPQPSNSLLHHARREAIFVGCLWFAAMSYTIGYCALFGYRDSDSAPLQLIFGFPDWVFWGIVVPWLACVVVGIWFSYAYMADDDISDGLTESDESEEKASV